MIDSRSVVPRTIESSSTTSVSSGPHDAARDVVDVQDEIAPGVVVRDERPQPLVLVGDLLARGCAR